MFKHILVAYDGSDHSKCALDKAINLAEGNPDCKLSVLHVYNLHPAVMGEAVITAPAGLELKFQEMAEEVAKEAEEKVKHLNAEVTILQGYPSHQILEFVKEHQCDLIVVGSRGLGPIGKFFLGSVSNNIVQYAECPVLVIK